MPDQITFGIVADVHLGPEAYFEGHLRKVGTQAERLTADFVAAINTSPPQFVLHLGDVVQEVGDREIDVANYRRIFDILDGLAVPQYPVVGNHDLITMTPGDLLATWQRLASLSALAHGSPVRRERLYYSFDAGLARFVILHTTEIKDDHIFIDEEQRDWLDQQLARLTGPVVVVVHHSLADQDTTGNLWFEGREPLCLVAERADIRRALSASGKVVAVINGHLHWNQLTIHDGIPYITVQSLVENVTSEVPPVPCGAWSMATLTRDRLVVDVVGTDPAHFDVPLVDVRPS